MSLIKIAALEDSKGSLSFPATFSCPWKRGEFDEGDTLEYTYDKTSFTPLDTSVLAYWEDGSVKWTSHNVSKPVSNALHMRKHASPEKPVQPPFKITDSKSSMVIEAPSGLKVEFGTSGEDIIKSAVFKDEPGFSSGKLAGSSLKDNENTAMVTEIGSSIIEKQTDEKLVVLTVGRLKSAFDLESFIDFRLRTYLFAHNDVIKLTVSVIYNLSKKEKLSSLGLVFAKSFGETPYYDRHVKFTGNNDGIMSESCQSITGLWHASADSVRQKQAVGEKLPPLDDAEWDWDTAGLDYVPSFDEYSLAQLSSHGFEISKKFGPSFNKLKVAGGSRNNGSLFVGTPQNGGLSLGLTKFWEKYPTELQIKGLKSQQETNVSLWFYSPSAAPLDMSPYYDGLGVDDYKRQIEGLQVTYEDYEPGFCNPAGIGRSFEVFLQFSAPGESVITSKEFMEFANAVRSPPTYIADFCYIDACAVFPFWATDYKLATRAPSEKELEIEAHLDALFKYHKNHVELNDWYGFWDYGDIMHTADYYRHQWRYDVGGYAWDNSELSTDLWLWLYFLHTGRADVFRMAEAMTRHTGEVDVYHTGRFRGFGTRHGVQHWSDSSKQLRISNVLFRRFYYYLSGGDERCGELMQELNDSQKAMLTLDSHRKVQEHPPKLPENVAMANIGLDWGSLIGSWMTNWERRTDGWESARDKLMTSIKSLVQLPHGFANNAVLMNVETGECKPVPPPTPDWAISHLSTVFGLNESITELIEIARRYDPDTALKFIKFWTDYAVSFNADESTQIAKYGFAFPKANISLQQSHARCTAHVAWLFKDEKLAKDAVDQFFNTDGYSNKTEWKLKSLQKYDSVTGTDAELPFLSTNITSQYGISAIYILDKVVDVL